MKFTTNFGSGTKKSSDFPKAVEAFDAIEPSSFDTSKQSQAEHTTMFNNSSCFSKSKKQSSRSSFCPQTSGDVSAKTSTKGGLKQMTDAELKETSKSKGHKISGLFKKAKAKVSAKNSSLKTRAKSVFGKLSTKSKLEPHTVPSSVNKTKTHSSRKSDSKLSIPVPPKVCVQAEVHSTSGTQKHGSPKAGDYAPTFAPKETKTLQTKPDVTVAQTTSTSGSTGVWAWSCQLFQAKKIQKDEGNKTTKTDAKTSDSKMADLGAEGKNNLSGGIIESEDFPSTPSLYKNGKTKHKKGKKVKSTASESQTIRETPPSGSQNWVQKMCGFAPKSGPETMTNKDKKPEKPLPKVSETSKFPDEKKGSGFFGSLFLSPVFGRGEELPTQPQTRTFPALPSIFSFATNRTSVKVASVAFKATQAVAPELSSTVVTTGASYFAGKFVSKPTLNAVEEVCKSVCFFGYTSCEAVGEWFLNNEGVSSKVPFFAKKAQPEPLNTNPIFPLADVAGPPKSKPGIFSFFNKKKAVDEDSWVISSDQLKCAEGIPKSGRGKKDQGSNHTTKDYGSPKITPNSESKKPRRQLVQAKATRVLKSSSTAKPKMVGSNLNVEQAKAHGFIKLPSKVKKSSRKSKKNSKRFVPSLESVSELQESFFPADDRAV